MSIITEQELIDAAVDAQTLEDVVNGAADFGGDGLVHPRTGGDLKTIAKIFDEINTTGTGWLATAEEWATKTNGQVASTDYSAKAWSIGGTGVTDTVGAGAAKEWATKAEDSTVDGTEYSAKHYSAKAQGFATAAASSAAEGLFSDDVTIDNGDSPYAPILSEEGTLFRCDTTAGDVVINLDELSNYGEDMKFAFVKIDGSANKITVNRGGSSDIIDNGLTTFDIEVQYEINVLVGDSATGSWINAVQSKGILNSSVTNSKLADMIQATIKGRASGAGTGAPTDLTPTQVREIVGNSTDTTAGLVEKATEAEMIAGTVDKFPDANEVKNYVDSGGKFFGTVGWDGTTADNKTGTYSRENLNGVWNVNVVGHGVKVGHLIYIDVTSGSAGDDFLLVTSVVDADNFIALGNTAGATASGNCTLPFWTIDHADGVDNISYENTTGYGFINLTEDQGDTNWSIIGAPKPTGGGGAFIQPYDVSPVGVPHGGQGTRYIRFSSFTLGGTSTNFPKSFVSLVR